MLLVRLHYTDVSIYIDPLSMAGVKGTDRGVLGKIALCEFLMGKIQLHDCGLALAMPCLLLLFCIVLGSFGRKLSCPCDTDICTLQKDIRYIFFVCYKLGQTDKYIDHTIVFSLKLCD